MATFADVDRTGKIRNALKFKCPTKQVRHMRNFGTLARPRVATCCATCTALQGPGQDREAASLMFPKFLFDPRPQFPVGYNLCAPRRSFAN